MDAQQCAKHGDIADIHHQDVYLGNKGPFKLCVTDPEAYYGEEKSPDTHKNEMIYRHASLLFTRNHP